MPRAAGRSAVAPRARRARTGAALCRRKFLATFPAGFSDPQYLDWERNYKWQAHESWQAVLEARHFAALLAEGSHSEVAASAVRIESRTNLLFSFEKMAVRDAVKSTEGARAFAEGLYEFLHGNRPPQARFDAWCAVLGSLPRKQTRVLTWPVATVFGFIAQPDRHLFLKPTVTRIAARHYGFEFDYQSKPDMPTYQRLLEFAATVQHDLRDLQPRDLIDIQSFLWVQGSEEY